MLRKSGLFLKFLGTVALLVYLLVCGLVLAGRYWVLPNIDNWRPQLTQYLSGRYGVQVDADAIGAQWKGVNPSIVLSGVSLSPADKADSRQALVIPSIRATIDWRSLLRLRPVFLDLDASGLKLDVGRDAQGIFHLLGMSFNPEEATTGDDDMLPDFLRWLTQQERIVLSDATLRWTDAMREAPPLVADGVRLTLARTGASHNFSLAAALPPEMGATLDVRGVLRTRTEEGEPAVAPIPAPAAAAADAPAASDVAAPGAAASDAAAPPTAPARPRVNPALVLLPGLHADGDVYMRIDGLSPQKLAPWLDLPHSLSIDHATVQMRAGIKAGAISTLTTDIVLGKSNWHPGEGVQIKGDGLRLYLDGPMASYRQILRRWQTHDELQALAPPAPGGPPLVYHMQGNGLILQADYIFDHPLKLGAINARGTLQRPPNGPLRVGYAPAIVSNEDIQATVHGSWSQGGSGTAGLIELAGTAKRASLAAIERYLPVDVDPEVRDWMKTGLLAGQLRDADILLRGDLLEFPFQQKPETGDFKVSGNYEGGVIDYLPKSGKDLGWPRLEGMRGKALMHRADLQLTASHALMRPARGHVITLRDVSARIPNLEDDPMLTVKGDTSAPAAAYLALMKHSDLGAMLDNFFEESTASGNWRVPLSLLVPLTRGEDTQVEGAVHFSGSTVQLMPEIPPLTQTQGRLKFTHQAVQADGLAGRFLGGAMKLSGEVGAPGKGLRMEGAIDPGALASFADSKGLTRLKGAIPYTALLTYEPKIDSYTLSMTSSLKGVAVDLPAPLGKSADATLPLKASWRSDAKGANRILSVEVGSQARAVMRRSFAARRGPVFQAVALGVNKSPALPAEGTIIDAQMPEVDLDRWREVQDDFEAPLKGAAATGGEGRPLFAPLSRLRVQGERASFQSLKLDQMTLTAQKVAADGWRVDISSTQTAGTVQWREARGVIEGPVSARFHRLSIGEASSGDSAGGKGGKAGKKAERDEEADLFDPDDSINIPGVDLQVQKLTLYGHPLGTLSVKGVNQERGRLWRLDALRLSAPQAQLEGKGLWRLSGPRRGLTIDATARFRNLGDYLEQAGYTGLVIGGEGTLKGLLEWRNVPWVFKRKGLNGSLEINLTKGRLSSINSKSARLLELLSLQSFKRLARGGSSSGSVGGGGFPFDNLLGHATISNGILDTRDYRVNSPAGTIVLEGRADLDRETLDMQAAVVPNLDLSGAVLAAGIAINPIIGVGAFLTQFLLQAPLAQAMAVQYHISGPWSSPVIKEVEMSRKSREKTPPPVGG